MSKSFGDSPVLVHATISSEFDENVAETRELKLKECTYGTDV